ncbi:MAG: hypothetical protein ACKO5A_10155 [Actinomycetota bacterium]
MIPAPMASLRRGVSVGALALAVAVTALVGGADRVAAQPSSQPVVSVAFTPQPSVPGWPPCTAFPFEVVHASGNTPDAFRVTIRVNRRLCTPVGATAAVYAMAGPQRAWPQTLVERQTLTIQESGTYVVSYAKGCSPQQFDLLAGTDPQVTPTQISPFGPWHGPLLFTFDTSTSLQWFGCGPDPVIPEFPLPAVGLGAAAFIGGGVLWWNRRRENVPVGR